MARRKTNRPIESLPQRDETWILAYKMLRAWIHDDDVPYRPYGTLIVNPDSGIIQMMDVSQATPSVKEVLATLAKAMRRPPAYTGQKAHRPKLIISDDADLIGGLRTELSPFDIEAEVIERPSEIDKIFADLEQTMRVDDQLDSIVSVQGVTPQFAGALYAAAADYYRAAPWVQLTDQDFLAIQVGKQAQPYFVSVMGNGGIEYGLAMYRRWEDVERMFSFTDNPTEMIAPDGANSLTFGEIHFLPFDEIDALEQNNWDVADPAAYPLPLVYAPNRKVKRPGLKDLQWYEAALRAIPTFVADHFNPEQSEPAKAILTVETSAGPTSVSISYPAGDVPLEMRPANMDWPDFGDDFDDDFDPDDMPIPFDRRAMESAFAQMGAGFDDTELQQAQELMYQAWEESNPARRIILAHEALEVSPNCADAYVLLAEEEADTVKRALEYYEQGVAAGERALGEDYFKENVGYFWGLLETRPYMRARQGLANTLWDLKRTDDAEAHYTEMLRLNPGDNQGIRYSLLNLLVATGQDEKALALLNGEYHDDAMAEWLYTRALLTFKTEGAGPAANAALKEALKQNPHVPAYLTGSKRLPVKQPAFMGFGDENEAVSYVSGALPVWRKTPGALDWLQSRHKPAAKKTRKSKTKRKQK